MARAKGTDRAEARRRYRAIVKAQEEAEAGSEGQSTATATTATPGARSRGRASQALKPAAPQPAQKPGLLGAAKAAYREAHYREDLRYFVPLVTRTHAVWPTLLLTIVAVPLALALKNTTDSPVLGAVAFWLSPTPLLPSMIAGFLAPRATWLAGAINGFIVGAGLIVFLIVTNGQIPGVEKSAPQGLLSASVYIMATAVPFGAVLAAGTGWYKRFLAAMPGSRPRQTQQRRKTK